MGLYQRGLFCLGGISKRSMNRQDKKEIRNHRTDTEPIQVEKGYTAVQADRYEGIEFWNPSLIQDLMIGGHYLTI